MALSRKFKCLFALLVTLLTIPLDVVVLLF
jgi:hypothetical protein